MRMYSMLTAQTQKSGQCQSDRLHHIRFILTGLLVQILQQLRLCNLGFSMQSVCGWPKALADASW